MKWKVVWNQDAEQGLASIWLNDRFRQRIRDAAQEIDELLAADPLAVGESRSGNRRILFVPPLAAVIEVNLAQHLVKVLTIARYG